MPSFVPLRGDLLFVRGKSLLDQPIIAVTHSQYTHVAGYIKPDQLVEAQGFRKTGYQSPDFYAGQSDIYRYRQLTTEQWIALSRFIQQEIGSRYDYLLLGWELIRVGLGVALPYFRNRRKICSTLWADAYRAAGIDLCPGIRYPTPGELANSALLEQVGSF